MGLRLFADDEARVSVLHWCLLTFVCVTLVPVEDVSLLSCCFPLSSLAAAWGGGWKVRKVYCAIVDCR